MSKIERCPHDRDYAVIANAALRDERLSWKARGMLAYLLAEPDDWTVMQAQLVNAGPDGERVVRSALTELERAGYLERTIRNTPVGRFVQSIVREVPNDPTLRFATPTPRNEACETSPYEVPNQQTSISAKRSVGGRVVQHPLMVSVPSGRSAELPAWMRGDRLDREAALRALREEDDDGSRVPDATRTCGEDAEAERTGTE